MLRRFCGVNVVWLNRLTNSFHSTKEFLLGSDWRRFSASSRASKLSFVLTACILIFPSISIAAQAFPTSDGKGMWYKVRLGYNYLNDCRVWEDTLCWNKKRKYLTFYSQITVSPEPYGIPFVDHYLQTGFYDLDKVTWGYDWVNVLGPPANCFVTRASGSTIEKVVGVTIQIVDGTKDVVVSIVRNPSNKLAAISELGQRISTGLGGTISRVGGLVGVFGQALLDTEVAQGIRSILEAIRDADPRTCGLQMSPLRRKELQRILNETEAQKNPIQPKTMNNGINTFDVPVNNGIPMTLDPPLAIGFEYRSVVGGPLFAAFALPLMVPKQGPYAVEIYEGGVWRKVFDAQPLKQYNFVRPTSRFRVKGIPKAAQVDIYDVDRRWVTMLMFNQNGTFKGSIRSILGSP